MSLVAIISDTHVPSRADAIPEWVTDEILRADHTIHAGDFDSPRVYERVADLAGGNLTAARGNVDPPALGLSKAKTVAIDGVTFVVTHGTGSPSGWHDRVVETVRTEENADAVGVAGHTHEVVDERVDGTRLLNPGSATGATPADRETMFVATVEDGDLEVELRTG